MQQSVVDPMPFLLEGILPLKDPQVHCQETRVMVGGEANQTARLLLHRAARLDVPMMGVGEQTNGECHRRKR
jgi:hypothetical protein